MVDRLVLALDGSTRACGAALLRPRAPAAGDGIAGDAIWDVVAGRTEAGARGQAKILLRLVDELLREIGGGPADLGAIVVGTGPGTFTGVRIAVGTARALALALTVPVVGVSTLSALAAGATAAAAEADRSLLVPVIDARRDQLFFGVYELTEDLETVRQGAGPAGIRYTDTRRRWVRTREFQVCDRGALGGAVSGPALVAAENRVLVGELPAGAVFYEADVQAERLVAGQEFVEEPGEGPQGSGLTPWLGQVMAASERDISGSARPFAVRAGSVGTPEGVSPIYVRAPDADVHITKMRDPWAGESGATDGPKGR